MMTYEFADLDRLVDITFRQENLFDSNGNMLEKISSWLELINSEQERLPTALQKGFYSALDPEMAGLFISNHLAAASINEQQLRSYVSQTQAVNEQTLLAVYNSLCSLYEDIILYIRRYWKLLFDNRLPVPFGMGQVGRAALSGGMGKIIEAEQLAENSRMLKFVFQPLEQFLESGSATISFQRLDYYTFLLEQLEQLYLKGAVGTDGLVSALIDLNFNYVPFIQYLQQTYMTSLAAGTTAQKMEQLAGFIKRFSQIAITPATDNIPAIQTGFDPDRPPLTEQLIQYFEKELEFLRYTQELTAQMLNNFEKINTGLSVWQLAVFIEAFLQSGVFVSDNEHSFAETVRSVGKIVKTVGSENLSLESLRTKIYSLRNNSQHPAPGRKRAIEVCMDLFYRCYTICKGMSKGD